MKAGIIGAGGIAGAHYRGYKAAGIEVIAIADVSEAILKARRDEWGVLHTYTDYHDLLTHQDIDMVSICTPNKYHHPATVAAARAGKHILCEKPIALNLELAEEMIEVCRAEGVVLQIGHHMRSNGAAFRAKQMIERGDLGRLTFIKLRQAHDWAGAAEVRGAFGSLEASGGGTLLDNGCHMFDLARYFAGNVKEIYTRMATLKFEVEVEDTAVATLVFEDGILGSVENAWTATGWEEAFAIYGTKGSLEYSNRWEHPVLRHRFRESAGTTWGDTDTAVYDFASREPGQSNHARHIANFVAAIEGKREVICTGKDGFKAVRLVLAAYESAKSNRPVDPDEFFHMHV